MIEEENNSSNSAQIPLNRSQQGESDENVDNQSNSSGKIGKMRKQIMARNPIDELEEQKSSESGDISKNEENQNQTLEDQQSENSQNDDNNEIQEEENEYENDKGNNNIPEEENNETQEEENESENNDIQEEENENEESNETENDENNNIKRQHEEENENSNIQEQEDEESEDENNSPQDIQNDENQNKSNSQASENSEKEYENNTTINEFNNDRPEHEREETGKSDNNREQHSDDPEILQQSFQNLIPQLPDSNYRENSPRRKTPLANQEELTNQVNYIANTPNLSNNENSDNDKYGKDGEEKEILSDSKHHNIDAQKNNSYNEDSNGENENADDYSSNSEDIYNQHIVISRSFNSSNNLPPENSGQNPLPRTPVNEYIHTVDKEKIPPRQRERNPFEKSARSEDLEAAIADMFNDDHNPNDEYPSDSLPPRIPSPSKQPNHHSEVKAVPTNLYIPTPLQEIFDYYEDEKIQMPKENESQESNDNRNEEIDQTSQVPYSLKAHVEVQVSLISEVNTINNTITTENKSKTDVLNYFEKSTNAVPHFDYDFYGMPNIERRRTFRYLFEELIEDSEKSIPVNSKTKAKLQEEEVIYENETFENHEQLEEEEVAESQIPLEKGSNGQLDNEIDKTANEYNEYELEKTENLLVKENSLKEVSNENNEDELEKTEAILFRQNSLNEFSNDEKIVNEDHQRNETETRLREISNDIIDQNLKTDNNKELSEDSESDYMKKIGGGTAPFDEKGLHNTPIEDDKTSNKSEKSDKMKPKLIKRLKNKRKQIIPEELEDKNIDNSPSSDNNQPGIPADPALISLRDQINARLNALASIAKTSFPATHDRRQLLTKYIIQGEQHLEYEELNKKITSAQTLNWKLRNNLDTAPAISSPVRFGQGRELARLQKELMYATNRIKRLREEIHDMQISIPRNINDINETLQMSVAITKAREVNKALSEHNDYLQAQIQSLEKRVNLMTQKTSLYRSPRRLKKKI